MNEYIAPTHTSWCPKRIRRELRALGSTGEPVGVAEKYARGASARVFGQHANRHGLFGDTKCGRGATWNELSPRFERGYARFVDVYLIFRMGRTEPGRVVARTAAGNGDTLSMAADASPLLPKGKRTDLHHHPLSSVQKTFGNIVISVVGAGVLGLPYTYKRTGWLSGTIALTVIAASCYYCMLLLVRSRKRIERDERNDDVENFSDLGYFTFGEYGRHLVDAMVVLSQGAFCVAYLIFIGENLASVFAASSDGSVPDSSILGTFIRGIDWNTKVVYIWIVFPLQVALASFQSLTRLAPFSIFADVASVVAMLVVIKEDVKQIMIGAAQLQAFKGLDTVPFAIGVAIYSYEGFSLVLPLESAMEDKKKFSKVLGAALACITAGYIVFGLLGYLAFGEQTADIITLNLARGLGGVIVKILLCIALFFTFPVMMYPVYEVAERRTTGGRPSLIVRACIVVLAVWLAVSVPRFGAFLSLVGSSVCCILSFVLPCIFHLHVFGKELSWAETGVDYVFIIFGACFGLFGTISSVYDMMAH